MKELRDTVKSKRRSKDSGHVYLGVESFEQIPAKSVFKAIIKKTRQILWEGKEELLSLQSNPDLVPVYPIQVTHLNDNDASYIQRPAVFENYAKNWSAPKIKMMSAKTRQKLVELDRALEIDLNPTTVAIRDELGLSGDQFSNLKANLKWIIENVVKQIPEGTDFQPKDYLGD